jgi:hypothetical protein
MAEPVPVPVPVPVLPPVPACNPPIPVPAALPLRISAWNMCLPPPVVVPSPSARLPANTGGEQGTNGETARAVGMEIHELGAAVAAAAAVAVAAVEAVAAAADADVVAEVIIFGLLVKVLVGPTGTGNGKNGTEACVISCLEGVRVTIASSADVATPPLAGTAPPTPTEAATSTVGASGSLALAGKPVSADTAPSTCTGF